MEEKFTFFWNGPFSQWHPSVFEIDGKLFNCAEQWMMYSKAMLFDDLEIAERIMATNSPRTQKALGREVKNFNSASWNRIAKEIVAKGSKAKFEQNESLREMLFTTVGTTLVEASPYDTIWGIGLLESDSAAKSRTTWKGTNWLGEVLTEVRDSLLAKK